MDFLYVSVIVMNTLWSFCVSEIIIARYHLMFNLQVFVVDKKKTCRFKSRGLISLPYFIESISVLNETPDLSIYLSIFAVHFLCGRPLLLTSLCGCSTTHHSALVLNHFVSSYMNLGLSL